MVKKNKVEVLINGKVYTLIGVESQEYMQHIALYIDKKIEEIAKAESSKKLSTTLLSVLTSINVADDLFKMKEENEELYKMIEERDRTIEELSQKVHSFEKEMEKLQQENLEIQDLMEKYQLENIRLNEVLKYNKK